MTIEAAFAQFLEISKKGPVLLVDRFDKHTVFRLEMAGAYQTLSYCHHPDGFWIAFQAVPSIMVRAILLDLLNLLGVPKVARPNREWGNSRKIDILDYSTWVNLLRTRKLDLNEGLTELWYAAYTLCQEQVDVGRVVRLGFKKGGWTDICLTNKDFNLTTWYWRHHDNREWVWSKQYGDWSQTFLRVLDNLRNNDVRTYVRATVPLDAEGVPYRDSSPSRWEHIEDDVDGL